MTIRRPLLRTLERSRPLHGLAVLGMLLMLQCDPASTGIAAEIASNSARSVLQDARNAASAVLYDAENSADNVVSQGANELLFAVTQAEHIFAQDLDTQVNKLSHEARIAVEAIYQAQKKLEKAPQALSTIREDVSLDIQDILNEVRFRKGKRYVISSIDGLRLVRKDDGNYTIRVKGTGLGFNDSKARSEIELVEVAGIDITDGITMNPVSRHERELVIPAELIANLFADDHLTVVPLKLRAQIRQKKRFGNGTKKVADIQVEAGLSLFSANAGHLKVHGLAQSYGWVPAGAFTQTYNTPNNHCGGDCDDGSSFPLGGPWRGVGTSWTLPDHYGGGTPGEGQCRFSGGATATAVTGGGMVDQVSAGVSGNQMTVSMRTNSHSVRFSVSAPKECWGKRSLDQKVYFDGRVDFGGTQQLTIPQSTQGLVVEFDSVWGETYSGALPRSGEVFDAFSISSTTDGQTVVYVISKDRIG